MRQLVTRVIGVSNRNPDGSSRQRILEKYASAGSKVVLRHITANPGDPDTIEVLLQGEEGKPLHLVGYLPGGIGEKLAGYLDAEREITAVVHELVPVEDPPHTALYLLISF